MASARSPSGKAVSRERPCLRALSRERALPASVFGPVDFWAFRRLAIDGVIEEAMRDVPDRGVESSRLDSMSSGAEPGRDAPLTSLSWEPDWLIAEIGPDGETS